MNTANLESFVGKKWSECELEIRRLHNGPIWDLEYDAITTMEYVGNRVKVFLKEGIIVDISRG